MANLRLVSALLSTTLLVSLSACTTRNGPPRPGAAGPLVTATAPAGLAAAALQGGGASQITLRGPDGRTFNLVRDSQERIGEAGTVWQGHIANTPMSSATIVENKGAIAGTIFSREGTYRLRSDPGGTVYIERIDTRRFLPEAEPTRRSGLRNNAADPALDTCSTDSGDQIDVMVVYTDDARAAAGSTAAMEAEVYLAVSLANQSYANSNINQRLRLVHVAEVAYAETGNTTTDKNRLKAKTDGFLDQVHTLRDTFAADSVMMIASQYSNACGESFIMSPVGNAFEDSAFGVVDRNCSTANLSFPHELGHQMSARHDWANDPTDNSPFHFNHGYRIPSVWRTVMAYPCSSSTPCPRLTYFSNPGVSISGTPSGVSTEPQPTDNAQTLNLTAQTVANFRCSSAGRTDVWAKDTWSDTGAEPDPLTAGQPMWESPYIWVRNTQDPTFLHQHQHQDPEFGSPNWAYVKLHNGGAAASGTLHFYYGDASTGLVWPTSFTQIAAVPATITAHSTTIVEIPWNNLPGTGHYCLLARWVSSTDPMNGEGTDINANTINNNNIVWHNVNIVNLQDAAEDSFTVRVRAPKGQVAGLTTLRLEFPRNANGRTFADFGEIGVELDPRVLRGSERQEQQGLERTENGFRLVRGQQSAVLRGLALAPGEETQVRIRLRRPAGGYAKDVFRLRVEQVLEPTLATAVIPPRLVGGVTYDIRTGANAVFFPQRRR
jgi:hypothetical protein